MTDESTHFFASEQLPHLDRTIPAPADQSLSIGTYRYTLNSVCMTDKGTHFFTSEQLPHLDRTIPAPADQSLSIGTDRYTPNRACMTGESAKRMQFFDR